MFKSLRKQEGFTLIELMIVVAIIGILAAIAIPNFLTYQLKSRQSEAKTNLQAIRTSMLSFSGERGCFIGIPSPPLGVALPASNVKTIPVAWPNSTVYPPSPAGTAFCVNPLGAAVFNGVFPDIGFAASGNTYFRYAAQSSNVVAPIPACQLGAAPASGIGTAGDTGMIATASSNLDGDAAAQPLSFWAASNDNGATDCTIGVY